MVTIALAWLIGASPQSWLETDEGVYGYARSLEHEQDYYRAIGEFKRLRFFAVDSAYRDLATYEMGRCYLLAGRNFEAEQTFRDLSSESRTGPQADSSRMYLGLSQFQQGRLRDARNSWVTVLELRGCPLRGQAALSTVVSLLYEGDATEGRRVGGELLATPLLDSLLKPKPALRSVGLAAALSAVLPGAGHIYAGRPVDGLISLVAEAAAGWLFYRGIKSRNVLVAFADGAVAVGFYSGGIYGAALAARHHNDRVNLEYHRFLQGYLLAP